MCFGIEGHFFVEGEYRMRKATANMKQSRRNTTISDL
jgi:hypothetical protein